MPTTRGGSYAAVLRLPGASPIFGAALVARLSYGLLPLSLLFTIRQSTGSFGAAGTTLGLLGLTSLTLPAKARLVDRYGIAKVLPALALASALSIALLAVLALVGHLDAPVAIALGGLTGLAAPPLGPAMRVVWGQLTRGTGLKERAYTLDAICEESLYLIGPVAVGGMLVVAPAGAALLAAAALMSGGTVVMGVAVASRVPLAIRDRPRLARQGIGPLRSPGVAPLVLVIGLTAAGAAMAFTGVAARSLAAGAPQASGWIDAGLAAGSLVGGLLWGRRRHRRGRVAHLTGLLAGLAAGLALAGWAPDLLLLGMVMAVTGLAVSPLFVVSYLATDELAPEHQRAEASTWINTGNNVGGALGSALAGFLVEASVHGTVFWTGSVVVLVGILVLRLSARIGD